VPIEMPPLRERGDDLPLLIADLAERIAERGRPRVQFTPAAIAVLKQYRWPGNVRELGNLIERLSIQCGERPIGVGDLPPRYRPPDWTGEESVADTAAMPVATALPTVISFVATRSTISPEFTDAADTDAVSMASATCAQTEGDETAIAPAFADALLEDIPMGFDLRAHLETLERRLIVRAMELAGGIVAQAARLLGLRRTTLVEKLRKYSLVPAELAASER
ncbi:MAG: helix-turn-helix domain-containing protein, partial [Steroidobacterales bacterium]